MQRFLSVIIIAAIGLGLPLSASPQEEVDDAQITVLELLITATTRSLEQQQYLLSSIKEYKQAHTLFSQDANNKRKASEMIEKANSTHRLILESHLSHLFSPEFIKELQSNTYPLPKRVTTDPEKVLTIDQVLKWCDQYFDKQGRYPGQTSESLRSMKEEKFVNIDAALRNGGRGLAAVGGLPGLLEREREHRHNKNTPNLNEETVVGWLITEYRATGSIRWPTAMDGTVYGHAEEKWSNLNACLHGGSRGFKKGGSIAQLKRRAMRRV